ncbi:MAG: enoyl-CoA hydratase/isomerase family protein [Verrucomicrobiota bacterium]
MQVTQQNQTITWKLNRPEHENGLDIATIESMERSLTELEREADPQVVCLLVVGQPTIFSTGLDRDLLENCFSDATLFHNVVQRVNHLLNRLEILPLVSIACVEGTCRLGGLELALACDWIIAGESATFSDGHLAYDAMPGGGATRRLPARLGYPCALRFILQKETLNAADAAKRGLVDEAVPSGDALSRANEIATSLATAHPSVIHGIKSSLRAAVPQVSEVTESENFQRAVINRLVAH